MKKIFILLTLLLSIFVIASCGAEAVQTGTDDSTSAPLTLDQLQHDPMSFTGSISVMGVVGDYGRYNFSLSSSDADFELAIDYRGSQALPEIGTVIIATGRMNYRRCCGPHLVATSFVEAQS